MPRELQPLISPRFTCMALSLEARLIALQYGSANTLSESGLSMNSNLLEKDAVVKEGGNIRAAKRKLCRGRIAVQSKISTAILLTISMTYQRKLRTFTLSYAAQQ